MSLTTEQKLITALADATSKLDTAAMNSLVSTLDEDAKARLSAVLNAPISAPRVDKQDLILRALDAILRFHADDVKTARPHVERMTKLVTEIKEVLS